ncbi:MAG: hypothetical protein HY355_03460 [Armatimonadetes bacterium]|nr:hypothetical protein [Armatimonadota bacterium]
MAAEPVPTRELADLHQRIGGATHQLRTRLRQHPGRRSRGVAEVVRAGLEVLQVIRATPSLAVRVGVTLLVVAGIAAALAARGRRQEAGGRPEVSTAD